jgi:hypothetical protein
MENTNATTPATPEVAGYDQEGAAQALLARWGVKPDEPATDDTSESEAQEAESQTETTPEQADEATADGAADESEAIEIDVAGEKFALPKAMREQAERIQRKVKDLEAGTTKKFQEAAEIRKVIEAEREQATQLSKFAREHTDLLADARSVSRELERMGQIDWQAYSDSDPVAAQKALARMMTLQNAQSRIAGALQDAAGKMTQAEAALRQQQVERGVAMLTRIAPDLANDSARKALAEYIGQRDLTPEGRAALYDPEVVAAFSDAKKYRELQAAKPAIAKRAAEAPKPALKTSAANTIQSAQRSKATEAVDRLKKTGRVEDAAAALIAKMRARS